MIKVADGYKESRITEFEPDARMPLNEAYPLHGFDGCLILVMATDDYMIHAIQQRGDGYIVRAGDRKTHILPSETMVYVKFSDLSHERRSLSEKENTISRLKSKYGITE